MEEFANPSLEPQAQIQVMQNEIIALLRRMQDFPAQHGDRFRVAESEMLLQQALSRISVGTDDDGADWLELEDIDWKAFGAHLVKVRNNASIQQKELAHLVGVSAQHLRTIEAGVKRPSRALVIKLLAVPKLGLLVSDITGDANRSGMVATSWFAPKYDPMQMITDMKAKILGSGDSLEQSTAGSSPFSMDSQLIYYKRTHVEEGIC